ncbi:RidA family protein [Chthonobacter rhizosphaerae]|uniref:RidA family protein n=1 Tax=Chthonobacter rhizosphaerae TaxID=2735553 RepID=UPI0015EF6006|nr:RidA family protein [Chthonobacter rhizosphaerae]
MATSLTPTTIRPPFGRYSHGIVVPAGARLLVTSGQLGVRPDDTVPDDVSDQAEICFAACAAILAEAGMSFADVIRINAFVTRREDFPAYMAVRDRWVSAPPPASTLVIVTGFTRPEFKVEVEVTAAKVP